MVSQQIGNYRIVRPIGAGGMGAVYEAVHDQIRRRAAIKVLRAEYARNPEVTRRFIAEARAVNLISHPNVVAIYELGQLPGGEPFIVMEYLDGDPLSERMPRQAGPVQPGMLRMVRQIASALQAAHDKGIIHRDLKPDNVLIVPDPETPDGERVKVLDFGIAKMASDEEGGDTAVRTRTGMLMGTPRYMSPEQCRGAGGVTDRSDVYSLGIILYELLTGRAPFRQGPGQGPGDLLVKHLTEPPAPVGELNPEVPAELTALTERMLVKSPEERPAMKEVVARLDAWLRQQGEPGSAPWERAAQGRSDPSAGGHPSTFSQAAVETRPPGRRSRRWYGIGAAGLLAAAVGYGALSGSGGHPARPPIPVGGTSQSPPPMASPPVKPRPRSREVRWMLDTVPSKALVLREANQAPLGETPLSYAQPAGVGGMGVVLKKKGFADRHIVLSLESDQQHREVLEPARGSRTAPRRAAAQAPAPPPRKDRDYEKFFK